MAFVAITALAAGLRLWHLDLISFGHDEAGLLIFAEDIVRLGKVPLNGPTSSVGLSTPAHFIYVIAPLVAVSREPAFVAAFLAVLGAAGVAMTMALGWRAFGPIVGLAAGLLFAVNPVAVAYGRRIWQPDVLPVLAALLLLALDFAIVERRFWWAAATFPIATLATLVHTAFIPLLPFLLAPAALLAIHRRWVQLGLGIVTASLIAIPFVRYEIDNQWQDYPSLRYFSSLRTFVDLESLRWVVAITTGWMLPSDGIIPPAARVIPQSLTQVTAAAGVTLLVVGMLLALVRILRAGQVPWRSARVRLVGLVLWILLPVLLNIRHWQPLFLHYFFGALPAGFLVMALPSAPPRIRARAGLVGASATAFVAVAVISTLQAVSTWAATEYLVARAEYEPCFMMPIRVMREIDARVAAFGRTGGSTRAVIELDSLPAKPMAYLLRDDFPHVFLPPTRLPSETPTLVGDIGLGSHAPIGVPNPAADVDHAVPMETRNADIRYANGLTLHSAMFTPDSTLNQQLIVAINWSVDAEAMPAGAAVWELSLTSLTGAVVATDAGDGRDAAAVRGERLLSLLWFDTRRDLAPAAHTPGRYQLTLRLMDAAATPRQVVPFSTSNGTSAEAFTLPVTILEHQRCDLN